MEMPLQLGVLMEIRCCIHWHRYVEGHRITVEAALSSSLPMSVLLGTDNPELL